MYNPALPVITRARICVIGSSEMKSHIPIIALFVSVVACGPGKQTTVVEHRSDSDTTVAPKADLPQGTTTAEVPNVPFAMTGGGMRHHHRSEIQGPAKQPRVLRTFTTGARIFASPIIGPDGTVYVGSVDGSFNAIRRTGELRWSYICKEPIFATAAISGSGVVYTGCDDDSLLAFAQDGTLRFTYRTTHDMDSPPVISDDGTIYVGSDGVHAVSSGGKRKWKLLVGGHVNAAAAVRSDGVVVVGSHDHRMYGIAPSGVVAFAFGTGGIIQGAAAVLKDDDVVFGGGDGVVYRLAKTGGLRWKTDVHADIEGGVAVSADETRLFVGAMDGTLMAIDAASGEVRWRTRMGGALRATPMLDSDGVLFIGSRDHYFYAVSSAAGNILWRLNLGAEIDSTAAIAAGRQILVGCDDGNLYFIGEN